MLRHVKSNLIQASSLVKWWQKLARASISFNAKRRVKPLARALDDLIINVILNYSEHKKWQIRVQLQ